MMITVSLLHTQTTRNLPDDEQAIMSWSLFPEYDQYMEIVTLDFVCS